MGHVSKKDKDDFTSLETLKYAKETLPVTTYILVEDPLNHFPFYTRTYDNTFFVLSQLKRRMKNETALFTCPYHNIQAYRTLRQIKLSVAIFSLYFQFFQRDIMKKIARIPIENLED